jgi:hypothetical protein
MHPSVRYSRLINKEDDADAPRFDYSSPFTYEDDHVATSSDKYNTNNDYNSVFKFRDASVKIKMGEEGAVEGAQSPNFLLVMTSWMLTFMSYTFFVLTFPVSYWIMVKKLGEVSLQNVLLSIEDSVFPLSFSSSVWWCSA